MSRFPRALALATVLATVGATASFPQDIEAGERVFRKCKACHQVGENAKNRVGPHLNDVFGRTAGTIDGFRYSKVMVAAGEDGLIWDASTMDAFIERPRSFMKGSRMSFPGLKKADDRSNLIAYLKAFSSVGEPIEQAAASVDPGDGAAQGMQESAHGARALARDAVIPDHGIFHLGRAALPAEVAAWDIDIRPDGTGLPVGKGGVEEGEGIYEELCATCHGDFGEGRDRWPILAGGHGTLTDERPEKTIGSYWPYLSTVYDYVRRAMPFGDAQSLSDDDVYAITVYLLYLNDVVTEEDFVLSHENFNEIRLPNETGFISDNRGEEQHNVLSPEPCISDCVPTEAQVVMRARVLDVTPDSDEGEGAGAIE